MSRSLYWRPVVEQPKHPLPAELKRAVAQRLWKHDGAPAGEDRELGEDFIPCLEELERAGVRGAADLIGVIREHGRVIVWIGD